MSYLESKFNKLEGRVEKLENAQSTTMIRKMEDGLQKFNTQVNYVMGEKIKEHCISKCKELENKLLCAEVYQRQDRIEKTDKDENSLKVLQSFLEWHCRIKPNIEFQHVHRIGKPHGDGTPRTTPSLYENSVGHSVHTGSFKLMLTMPTKNSSPILSLKFLSCS